MQDLRVQINKRSTKGTLYRKLKGKVNWIQCYACAHYCRIKDGKNGICKVRYNESGILKVPRGYVGAFQCDPIEKKPFYHAFPKTLALSYGMLGCDYKCDFCQNWQISQTLRDSDAGRSPRDITPEEIVSSALSLNARSVVSTYNEPLITSEWSKEIFTVARKEGLATGYVSNGNATKEVLDYMSPVLDMYKVDLKAFNERAYRSMGGNLEKVLKAIKMIYERGLWLEVVTLLIPGFNDDPEEIKQLTDFIAEISSDIPWHVTAFHKDYKMLDPENTTPEDLIRAVKIGKDAGLNFIYPGNLRGKVSDLENTYCPNCHQMLIERFGFEVLNYSISEDGKCPNCRTSIPGLWETPRERERLFYFLK